MNHFAATNRGWKGDYAALKWIKIVREGLLGVNAVVVVSVVALSVLDTTEASSLLGGAPAGPAAGQAGAVGNFQPSGSTTQTLAEFSPQPAAPSFWRR